MAEVKSVKKLIVEDFPADAREIIQRLASVLNPFMDQVVTALNQKLTYKDNLQSQRYDLRLAEGISTIVVGWHFNAKPSSVILGNLTKTNGQPPSQVFSMSSYHSDKKITLTFIGLDAATAHAVTVIAQI